MPPLPKGSRRPSTGSKRERASSSSFSSAATGTTRSRATKADVLGDQVTRMYMMVGTLLKPFGRFYPILGPVGENCQSLAHEASDAWMELAQKDKRVMEALETITGASVWGNVIGIHFAIFASALPGNQYVQEVFSQTDPMEQEFIRQGKAMGLSDEEIRIAMAQAMAGSGMPGTPAREATGGGPGDTVQTGGERTATATATPSGIVSPDQLGVENPGDEKATFPADPEPPNGSGPIVNE